MKKLTTAIIALTLTFAAHSHAYAKGFGDKISSALNLTPEQTVRFAEVQSKREAYLAEAILVRGKIKALVNMGDVDGAAMLAGQQAEKKVRNMYALKVELTSFLTEEQMTTLATIRERIADKRDRLKKFIND